MSAINLLGLLFAIGVLVFSMVYGNPNPWGLLDPHGALIVIGGTAACVGVAYRLDRAASMIMIFFKGLFKTNVPKSRAVIEELMAVAEAYRTNSPQLDGIVKNMKDPFMQEAVQALVDHVVDETKLVRILTSRVNTMYQRYSDEAKLFTNCGKYPPAMGLMGAVLGMIGLLSSLGTPGAEKNIGPAMSVALIATLYGIAFANLFVIPIGENLQDLARSIKAKNLIIVEGVKLISQKVNPLVLAEELNSFLLPSERVDWKKKK